MSADKNITAGSLATSRLCLVLLISTMSGSFSDLLQMNDVISDRNGGTVLFATDDFFAVAENLIKGEEPVWKEDVYTEYGKWMDGWETRRKRIAGHDFCILQAAAPVVVHGINVNTMYFTGNHAPTVSIQASEQIDLELLSKPRNSEMGTAAPQELINLANTTNAWKTILEPVDLKPGYSETCHNFFRVNDAKAYRYFRFNLFPDGGVARLRLFGIVNPPQNAAGKELDLAAFMNGGEIVSYSNAHFGHPKNLIGVGRGTGMADGWETARRLDRPKILQELFNGQLNHSGEEWCIFRLGIQGRIHNIIVDTNHFKGNFPDLIQVEATQERNIERASWQIIVPFSKVTGHKEHLFNVTSQEIYRNIRLTIRPDGGVSRLRVFGNAY